MNDLKERLKEFLRIKNYSQHTISNYERDINRFLFFLEENKTEPHDLLPATLTQWLIFLRKKFLTFLISSGLYKILDHADA